MHHARIKLVEVVLISTVCGRKLSAVSRILAVLAYSNIPRGARTRSDLHEEDEPHGRYVEDHVDFGNSGVTTKKVLTHTKYARREPPRLALLESSWPVKVRQAKSGEAALIGD